MPTPAAVWVLDKLTNGDFKVVYPDNTCDGAPEKVRPMKKSPAPTTAKTDVELEHIPGLGMQEKVDPIVDILNYITKTKGIELTNTQIVFLIEILK
jgi:hypothetical protein